MGIPTALVIASKHDDLLQNIQKTFTNDSLRVYTSHDLKGTELGGALKNIIAFCAGVIMGLEFGDNTFAALITRGLSEMARLSVAMGGKPSTMYGLTGLGDLIVTCLSSHSRNRRAGVLFGQGKTVHELKKEIGMTIESMDNIETTYELAKKYNIEMPIVNAIYDVLFNEKSPADAINELMRRDLKEED